MTVVEALKSAQFVVDSDGQQTAVLLDIQSWQALVDWIEDITDIKVATQTIAELEAAGGDPSRAGWLAWDDIREEWRDETEIEA